MRKTGAAAVLYDCYSYDRYGRYARAAGVSARKLFHAGRGYATRTAGRRQFFVALSPGPATGCLAAQRFWGYTSENFALARADVDTPSTGQPRAGIGTGGPQWRRPPSLHDTRRQSTNSDD